MHVSENVVCYWILTLKTHIYIYLCTLTISEQMAKKMIIGFIDFFFPPFCRIMPLQTFRYAACGGANTFLDIFLFFIIFNSTPPNPTFTLPFLPSNPTSS